MGCFIVYYPEVFFYNVWSITISMTDVEHIINSTCNITRGLVTEC